jgi:hypothetical protein
MLCVILIVQGTPLKTHHAEAMVSRLEHSWRTAVQRRHEAHRRRARRMSVSLKKTLVNAVFQWTNRAAPIDRFIIHCNSISCFELNVQE